MVHDLFPIDEIRPIIEENVIAEARGSQSDPNMRRLIILWKEYVEPDLNPSCGLCITRILDNWRNIQDRLAKRVYDDNLLA